MIRLYKNFYNFLEFQYFWFKIYKNINFFFKLNLSFISYYIYNNKKYY